jgi:hypothetical protein
MHVEQTGEGVANALRNTLCWLLLNDEAGASPRSSSMRWGTHKQHEQWSGSITFDEVFASTMMRRKLSLQQLSKPLEKAKAEQRQNYCCSEYFCTFCVTNVYFSPCGGFSIDQIIARNIAIAINFAIYDQFCIRKFALYLRSSVSPGYIVRNSFPHSVDQQPYIWPTGRLVGPP